MSQWLRRVLVLLLAAPLAGGPAAAASNPALGFILQTRSALLDGTAARNGANLYGGDVLSTSPDGSLSLQLSANQVFLFPSSRLDLTAGRDGVTASLSRGVASFSARQGRGFSLRALGVLVRPMPGPTRAQVEVSGANELLVTSFRGPLELEYGGRSYQVAEGHTYKVEIPSAAAQEDAGSHMARSRKRLVILIFGGAVAAYVGTYVYHELAESPSVP